MPGLDRPRILFVDDEPNILAALQRVVPDDYEVSVAGDAKEALKLVLSHGPFHVVVADLQMPGMDGVALLYCLKEAAPETVRVLLTGHADVDAAVAAVNQGNVFRFLTKPCPKGILLRALEACVDEYRRVTAERSLNPSQGSPPARDGGPVRAH